MAQIDISCVLTSPMLTTLVSLKRRVETVDNNGRTVPDANPTISPIYGVLSSDSENALIREAEAQYGTKAITFRTKTRLRSAAQGAEPDIITWKGSDFVVRDLRDDTQWGSGFTLAVCTSVTTNDPAPV